MLILPVSEPHGDAPRRRIHEAWSTFALPSGPLGSIPLTASSITLSGFFARSSLRVDSFIPPTYSECSVIDLLIQLFAGYFDLLSVYDDYVIACIYMRSKLRFVFTSQNFCHFRSQTSQSTIRGINYIPFLLDLIRISHKWYSWIEPPVKITNNVKLCRDREIRFCASATVRMASRAVSNIFTGALAWMFILRHTPGFSAFGRYKKNAV